VAERGSLRSHLPDPPFGDQGIGEARDPRLIKPTLAMALGESESFVVEQNCFLQILLLLPGPLSCATGQNAARSLGGHEGWQRVRRVFGPSAFSALRHDSDS
jgi:hypothetical protein